MTEKQILGFKPRPRLEQIGDNMPSERRIVYIAPNDGLILPHRTNPGPMEYSEETQLLTPQNRRLKSKDKMPQPTRGRGSRIRKKNKETRARKYCDHFRNGISGGAEIVGVFRRSEY